MNSPPTSSKSLKKAYLLWLFLGLFGVHRFYFRKKISGTILLILTVIWGISYLGSAQKPFGILALVDLFGPFQDWLVSFGQIGKWVSALMFLPFLLFPAFWWFTDIFRIPRIFKEWEKEMSFKED
jgi:TM2 domain-containing membrane protein YozV